MMDEFSSDKAFHYSNGIVDKEQASDKMIADEEMASNVEAKKDPGFCFAKELHQTINEEVSREFSSVVSTVDFKTVEAPVHSSLYTLAPSKEMCCKVSSCSINQFKPFIRKKIIQKEMAFDRECKKLETVWGNRGLPVDKKTLRSAARKDAFDMSDLSESLPSTSASKKNTSVILRRRRVQRSCMSEHRARKERLAEFGSLSLSSSSIVFTKDCIISTTDGKQSYTDWRRNDFKMPPSELEKLRRISPASVLQSLSYPGDRGAQKEASEKNEDTEKGIRNLTHEEAGHHSVCPDFEKMSLDDKQEEIQNPVAAKIPEHIRVPPLSQLRHNVGQFSGWDSERNRSTHSQAPDLCVPLNSPVKNEGMADKKEKIKAFLDSRKKLLEVREMSLQLWRAHCKLKALRPQIALSENITDRSASEKPSSEQASNRSRLAEHQHMEEYCEMQLKRSRLLCKKMLIQLKESVKNLRNFPSRPSHGNVKSDKVLPD